MTKKKNRSILLYGLVFGSIASAVAFIVTAVFGVIEESNPWPPAGFVYAIMAFAFFGIVGVASGGILNTRKE